jgi:phospholipid N-methyltransferase
VTIRNALAERQRFLRSFLANPRRVGSILPTSRRTVRAMLDMVSVEEARCVVELGAGTGPLTREILPRLRPDARLLAFEIDASLARTLGAELQDPRLEVVPESATNAEAHLNGRRADVVLSVLPFTSLPAPARSQLLETSRRILADEGVMVVLQYSAFILSELRRTFASVERRLAPFNVPPAVLFACRPDVAARQSAPPADGG